ncbi:MAG: metallophosphoesterase [Planctomycetota bacterium]
MTRIGVISDTHDRLPTLRSALDRFAALGLKTVLHAGDIVAPFAARPLAEYPGTVHVVYGNNDGERRGLREILPRIQDGPLLLDLEGRRVLLHHALEWCRAADIAAANVIVTGHTHEAGLALEDGKLFVNSGECCGWVTGRATAAIVDLAALTAELIEIPT